MTEIKEKTAEAVNPKTQLNITTEERILQTLSTKPISRYEITFKLKLSEREVRRSIETMRNRGVPICSNSTKGGYWLGNAEDCRHTAAEYRAKAYKMLHTAAMLDGQLDGQIEMGEL